MYSKPYRLIRLIYLDFYYFFFNSGWSVWKYWPELNRRSGNRAPTYFMTVFLRHWPKLLPYIWNFINQMGAYSFFYHWWLLAGINYLAKLVILLEFLISVWWTHLKPIQCLLGLIKWLQSQPFIQFRLKTYFWSRN